MPGNKIRSKYKKKRKGFQNRKIDHEVHKLPRPGPSVNTYENKPSSPFINPKVTSDLSNMKQSESVAQFGEALKSFHACDEGKNMMSKISLHI